MFAFREETEIVRNSKLFLKQPREFGFESCSVTSLCSYPVLPWHSSAQGTGMHPTHLPVLRSLFCLQQPSGEGHLLPWQRTAMLPKPPAEHHKAIDPGRVKVWSKLQQLKNLCTSTVSIWKAMLCCHSPCVWENRIHPQYQTSPDQ